MILAQPPYSQEGIGGNHSGWNHGIRGIDYLTWRRTQGPGIVKGWEGKRDCYRYIHIKKNNMNAVMKEVKVGMGEDGIEILEEGKLPGLLYADN